MELSSIQHIDPGQLSDFEADVFLTTLSHESRCTAVARKLEKSNCRKIALIKADSIKEFSYQENKSYYLDHRYEVISVESRVPDLEAIFCELPKKQISIILDCTSMLQRWYFEFFRWISENQDDFLEATIRIVYTMGCFADHDPVRKVKSVKNFHPMKKGKRDKKKTALILGLGPEENICETIYNKVSPDLLYLFYSDPPVNKKFVEKVFVNNHALINQTPIRNLIAYPIRNGQTIYQILIDTILPLRNDYLIIIVPNGPKLLSVVAMLVYLGYPDIQISYPKFKKPVEVDVHPCDEPVVLDVLFDGES